MKTLMQRFGMKPGEVIEHPWVTRSIANAQKRVEGHNFDIRKNVLEYDDVMNQQRKAIYSLRREILGASEEQIREKVLDLIEDGIISIVSGAAPEKEPVERWMLDTVDTQMKELFGLDFDAHKVDPLTREGLENAC